MEGSVRPLTGLKDKMAPGCAPRGCSSEDSHCPPRGNNRSKPSPKVIVNKREGPSFASPFCDLLASWTEEKDQYGRSWPRNGSFEAKDMAIAQDCIRRGGGDPRWDLPYMQRCLTKWEGYVDVSPIRTLRSGIYPIVSKDMAGAQAVRSSRGWATCDSAAMAPTMLGKVMVGRTPPPRIRKDIGCCKKDRGSNTQHAEKRIAISGHLQCPSATTAHPQLQGRKIIRESW